MKKPKRYSKIGYIGGYWSLFKQLDGQITHGRIYARVKDWCWPIATGLPVKVKITIEEVK